MALSYTSNDGASAVAGLAAGTVVAAFSDGSGRSRSFAPAVAPPASSGVTAASIFPQIVSVTTVTDPAGSGQVGQVVLILKAAAGATYNLVFYAGDLADGTSPMVFRLDGDAVVISVSGSY
jgi:hypothetical protein